MKRALALRVLRKDKAAITRARGLVVHKPDPERVVGALAKVDRAWVEDNAEAIVAAQPGALFTLVRGLPTSKTIVTLARAAAVRPGVGPEVVACLDGAWLDEHAIEVGTANPEAILGLLHRVYLDAGGYLPTACRLAEAGLLDETFDLAHLKYVSGRSPHAVIKRSVRKFVKKGAKAVAPGAPDPRLVKLLADEDQDAVFIALGDLRGVTSLDHLATFTRLTSLRLDQGQVDLEPLTRLPALETLALGKKLRPKSLDVLERLPALRSLEIDRIPDLDLQLTDLTVGDAGKDLRGLARFPQLSYVSFYKGTARDLKPLAALEELQGLSLGALPVSDLRPLAALRDLAWVRLDGNKTVKTLAGLENKKKLQSVDASLSRVQDISALARSPALTSVTLRGAPITDASALFSCPNLTAISLEKTRLASIDGGEKVKKLAKLWLWDPKVKDLTPLAGCAALTELDLSSFKVDDWSFLEALEQLETLDLYQTNFSDPRLLMKLSKLKLVRVARSGVVEKSTEARALSKLLFKRGGKLAFTSSRRWR